jgi:hypothetical protein
MNLAESMTAKVDIVVDTLPRAAASRADASLPRIGSVAAPPTHRVPLAVFAPRCQVHHGICFAMLCSRCIAGTAAVDAALGSMFKLLAGYSAETSGGLMASS